MAGWRWQTSPEPGRCLTSLSLAKRAFRKAWHSERVLCSSMYAPISTPWVGKYCTASSRWSWDLGDQGFLQRVSTLKLSTADTAHLLG